MSGANTRPSRSSLGKNSTMQSRSPSSCQYGSMSCCRWLEIVFALRSQRRRSPCSRVLEQNSRYKNGTTKAYSIVFSVVPYRALQSDRCLVITFTAVTRVQIPSGTPNLFRDLERKSRFVVGTKGNSRTAKSHHPAVPELHFPRFDGFFVGTKRHNLTPQLRAPLRERETSELRHFELRVFVP